MVQFQLQKLIDLAKKYTDAVKFQRDLNICIHIQKNIIRNTHGEK